MKEEQFCQMFMVSGETLHRPDCTEWEVFSMFLRCRCGFSKLRNPSVALLPWDLHESPNLSWPVSSHPKWKLALQPCRTQQGWDKGGRGEGPGGGRHGSPAVPPPILSPHPGLSLPSHPFKTMNPLYFSLFFRLGVCFWQLPWQRRPW